MAHLLKKDNQFVKYYIHMAKYNYVKKTIYNYIEMEVFKKKVLMLFLLKSKYPENNLKINTIKKKIAIMMGENMMIILNLR